MNKRLTGADVSLEYCQLCGRHAHFAVQGEPAEEFCTAAQAESLLDEYRKLKVYPRGVVKRMSKLLRNLRLPETHLEQPGYMLETVYAWNTYMFEDEDDQGFHQVLRRNKKRPVSQAVIEQYDLKYNDGVHPENRRVH